MLHDVGYFDAFAPGVPTEGGLLLAAPFLRDRHFFRTVVLLCAHSKEGTIGYTLNRKSRLTLREVLQCELLSDFSLYIGGPVQRDTLHYLHTIPALADESTQIAEGLYWGRAFEKLLDMLKEEVLSPQHIKFFAGYAGWHEDQLQEEIKQYSWIVHNKPHLQHIFEDSSKTLWPEVLRTMGTPYRRFAHFPEDPTCN